MADVVLDTLCKTYPRGVEALRNVSLHVADGELLALVGPSGCGKTTLLRLIAGLDQPTSGQIRIAGRDVTREPPHRRDVAFVFQRPALYPHLNVADNLAFPLTLGRSASLDRAEKSQRVEETARLLGLDGLLERRPAELSGGQQQRLALGRALVRRPAVLLLDEPLSNLDAPLRLEMRRELHLLHRRLRATMIYVTHDQEEALTLGQRVAVLEHGAVRQVDRPEAVYQRPADRFVAGFLGWPPISLLDGRLVVHEGRLRLAGPDGQQLPLDPRPDWLGLAGREVTVGLRPEHIRVLGEDEPRVGRVGEVVVTMTVRLIERLGANRLLALQSGAWAVTARLDGERAVAESADVAIALDLNGAHLFDRAGGQALSHGAALG
jgi:ABC-type sugar transport system ATPase subunit